MGDKGLEASMQKIEEALQDPDAFDTYMTIKIEKMHQENMMNEREEKGIKIGEEKGIKIGEEKGKEEKELEIANNLKIEGFPLEIIAKTTGIPLSKVKNL